MKFSKETLAVLKNFAGINSNIAFQEGNRIKTISPQRNVFAYATVPETFETKFGIYDLNQFLGVLSLFSDPDVSFGEKVATIKEGKTQIRYVAADESVLILPPDKNVKFPSADIVFDIPAETLSMLLKTSSVLGSPDISVVGDGETMKVVVGDLKNPSANSYEVSLGETDKTFQANLKVENLKMINQSYTVSISSTNKISKWDASDSDMQVYVALEASSKF